MQKICVICGALFNAPPSSKKITCSKQCSAKRKSISHTGISNEWSNAARLRLSTHRKQEGYSENARAGLTAAMALPDSRRGVNHRDAKKWILIDPDGKEHHIVNLTDWARRHADMFDTVEDDKDRDRVANNIRSGFGQIIRSMQGKRKETVNAYKGWSVVAPPTNKNQEDSPHEKDHR